MKKADGFFVLFDVVMGGGLSLLKKIVLKNVISKENE